ncbi:MAG: hypothetical protein OXI20_07695, partial [Rhodospirillales bacterium]|nr:hypothetical protein [Rhodospirillales bacterium]
VRFEIESSLRLGIGYLPGARAQLPAGVFAGAPPERGRVAAIPSSQPSPARPAGAFGIVQIGQIYRHHCGRP